MEPTKKLARIPGVLYLIIRKAAIPAVLEEFSLILWLLEKGAK
jgi:hypothetical protein